MLAVLKSEKFWTALAAVLVLFVIPFVPEFEGVRAELILVIGLLGALTVGGAQLRPIIDRIYDPLLAIVSATRTPVDDQLFALLWTTGAALYPDVFDLSKLRDPKYQRANYYTRGPANTDADG